MKRARFVVAAAFAIAVSGRALGEDSTSIEAIRKRLEAGQPTRIVCFGDSITGAYYHTGGVRAWGDMLGIALAKTYPKAKVEMVNAGISGHTTTNGLARIDADVIAKRPDLVVVMFGMNDVTGKWQGAFEANLREIVAKCRATGAAVVLCTPNSVYDTDARRSSDSLAALAESVKGVAKELSLPVADCFDDYRRRRERDETAWMLTMSDEIHPNMHGHCRFAELIAETITGRNVELRDVPPPDDALGHTLDRLEAGERIHIVTMAPYDRWLREAFRKAYPAAVVDVTPWPTETGKLADMREWAAGIRALKPDLVMPAVPATAQIESDGDYIRDYEWVLNYSFPFAGREWDVLPALPSLAAPVEESRSSRLALAREIVRGKDVIYLERASGDERPAEEILAAWIAERVKTRATPSADSKAATP